jgi:hypothetical protein
MQHVGRCCQRDEGLPGARARGPIMRVVVMPMAGRNLFRLEVTAAELARACGNALELSEQQCDCDEPDLQCARHPISTLKHITIPPLPIHLLRTGRSAAFSFYGDEANSRASCSPAKRGTAVLSPSRSQGFAVSHNWRGARQWREEAWLAQPGEPDAE